MNIETAMKTYNKRDLAETCISLGKKLNDAEAEIERLTQALAAATERPVWQPVSVEQIDCYCGCGRALSVGKDGGDIVPLRFDGLDAMIMPPDYRLCRLVNPAKAPLT